MSSGYRLYHFISIMFVPRIHVWSLSVGCQAKVLWLRKTVQIILRRMEMTQQLVMQHFRCSIYLGCYVVFAVWFKLSLVIMLYRSRVKICFFFHWDICGGSCSASSGTKPSRNGVWRFCLRTSRCAMKKLKFARTLPISNLGKLNVSDIQCITVSTNWLIECFLTTWSLINTY